MAPAVEHHCVSKRIMGKLFPRFVIVLLLTPDQCKSYIKAIMWVLRRPHIGGGASICLAIIRAGLSRKDTEKRLHLHKASV